MCAMALRYHTIRRVQKIFALATPDVVTAKRLLVGHVAIDLLPAQRSASFWPRIRLIQIRRRRPPRPGRTRLGTNASADHDSPSSSKPLKEIAKQLPKLSRANTSNAPRQQ